MEICPVVNYPAEIYPVVKCPTRNYHMLDSPTGGSTVLWIRSSNRLRYRVMYGENYPKVHYRGFRILWLYSRHPSRSSSSHPDVTSCADAHCGRHLLLKADPEGNNAEKPR